MILRLNLPTAPCGVVAVMGQFVTEYRVGVESR